jgi:hypothetical protein
MKGRHGRTTKAEQEWLGFSQWWKKYYQNNKERIRKYQKEHYIKRKNQALKIKEGQSNESWDRMAEILFGGV